MKQLFYHFRNKKNEPVITICLLQDEQIFARGISICSLKETPIKTDGRNRAKGRAEQAFRNKETTGEKINRQDVADVFETLIDYDVDKYFETANRYVGFEFKSYYDPTLTEFEELLISNKRKK
jgi:hypothetical protein